MDNKLNCIFKADIRNIRLARNVAQIFYADLDSSLGFLNEIKTIISEAVTNAIIHGCNGDNTMDIYMNLSYDHDFIYIEVIDKGVGIKDIELAKTPMYTTKPEEDRSGLGFTIMDIFSDEMIVESTVGEGCRVKVIKSYDQIE